MNTVSPAVSSSHDLAAAALPPPVLETPDGELAEWFEAAPTSRRSSTPPPVTVGEFLGDPLADAWLR